MTPPKDVTRTPEQIRRRAIVVFMLALALTPVAVGLVGLATAPLGPGVVLLFGAIYGAPSCWLVGGPCAWGVIRPDRGWRPAPFLPMLLAAMVATIAAIPGAAVVLRAIGEPWGEAWEVAFQVQTFGGVFAPVFALAFTLLHRGLGRLLLRGAPVGETAA